MLIETLSRISVEGMETKNISLAGAINLLSSFLRVMSVLYGVSSLLLKSEPGWL